MINVYGQKCLSRILQNVLLQIRKGHNLRSLGANLCICAVQINFCISGYLYRLFFFKHYLFFITKLYTIPNNSDLIGFPNKKLPPLHQLDSVCNCQGKVYPLFGDSKIVQQCQAACKGSKISAFPVIYRVIGLSPVSAMI